MAYSSYKKMIDTQPNLRVLSYTEEYRRYSNVQLALVKLGEAVESYTVKILGDVHSQIVQQQQSAGLSPCTKGCSQQHAKHNLNAWCQTCKDWKSELEKFFETKKSGATGTLVSLSNGVQWHKLKSWEWHKDPRNLAEVFLQPGWNTTNLNLQDLTTASGIWTRCNLAHASVRSATGPIKEIRNQLAHGLKLKLTEQQTRDAFANILAFLNVPEVRTTLHDAVALETKIKDLEQDCFNVIPTGTPQPPLSGGLTIVSREEWQARRPKEVENMGTPVSVVIIHHSGIGEAFDQERCAYEARHIQNFQMDDKGWADVAYNFLIGEDGRVYEGRGWNRVGAHTFGWNRVAVSLCFMGDYTTKLPSLAALHAAQLLIQEGLQQNKIAGDYKLYGHRDLRVTGGPGQQLYNHIQNWAHYDHSEPVKPPEVPYTP